MADEAKRGAQEALYAAIQNQAETNIKAAISAPDKAALVRDLAEAYRLTAGGALPDGTGGRKQPSAEDGGGKSSGRPRRRSREG
jgi:hypothetical protein